MSFGVDTDELNRDSNLSAFLASKKAAIDVEAISGFWAGARPSACGRGPADSVSPRQRPCRGPSLTYPRPRMAVPRKPCCLSRAISFCLEVPCR